VVPNTLRSHSSTCFHFSQYAEFVALDSFRDRVGLTSDPRRSPCFNMDGPRALALLSNLQTSRDALQSCPERVAGHCRALSAMADRLRVIAAWADDHDGLNRTRQSRGSRRPAFRRPAATPASLQGTYLGLLERPYHGKKVP
jgi:hypothetical protein